VIKSFKGDFARLILERRRIPKGFSTEIAKIARRKLVQLNNATVSRILQFLPVIGWKR